VESGRPPTSQNILQQALAVLALGLRPFPVSSETKRPFAGEAWEHLQNAAPTEEEVVRAFTAHPDSSGAVVTGHEGGLDIVDRDVDADGRLPPWPDDPNKELPTGLVIRTPSGGLHYAFRHIPGIKNSTSKLAPHVDVRGTGGYFVAVGPGREILAGSFAEALDTEAPEWLSKALISVSGNGARPRPPVGKSLDVGERNVTLASLAGSMRRRGMSQEAITAALGVENLRKCRPPLPEAEVRAIAESIGRYPPAGSEFRCTDSGSDCAEAFDSPHLTDMGNARRFAVALSSSVRYCHPQREWLVWTGSHWVVDRQGLVGRMLRMWFAACTKRPTCRLTRRRGRTYRDGLRSQNPSNESQQCWSWRSASTALQSCLRIWTLIPGC
jgi:putative DNA primase/helicase